MEKKRLDLACLYFVKIWEENPILYCIKNKELEMNLFLYKKYILPSFPNFCGLVVIR